MNKQKEAESLVELLNIGSQEYKDGKHCSAQELKEKLKQTFKQQKESK